MVSEDRNGNLTSPEHYRVNVDEVSGPAAGDALPLPAPMNGTPANGAVDQPMAPSLSADGFADPNDAEATHAASRWQVWPAYVDLDHCVWEIGISTTDLIAVTLSEGLLASGLTYAWRVCFQSSSGYWSSWSTPTSSAVTGNAEPPVASFTATPRIGDRPLAVAFSNDSTGIITGWEWDFDDDAIIDAHTADPPMAWYIDYGDYSPSPAVTGYGGTMTHMEPDYITVMAMTPPETAFSAEPLSGDAPLLVTFTDGSSGEITARHWDFDNDGTVDAVDPEAPVTFLYGEPGVYSVRLLVEGPAGQDEAIRTDYVSVNSLDNEAPVAEVTETVINLPNLAAPAVLDASGSWDPDDDLLYYSWREDPDNPVFGLLPLNSENMPKITVFFPVPGLYVFDLVVSDGQTTSLGNNGGAPVSVNVEVPGLTGITYALPTWGDVRVPNTTVAAFTSYDDVLAWRNPYSVMIADSRGRYRLENLNASQDTWWIGWRRNGYIDDFKSVPGGNTMASESLGMARSSIDLLQGTITTPAGQALHGVRVSLVYGADVDPLTDDTNDSGVFAMASVPEGNWQLQLYKLGYRAEVRDITITPGMDSLELTLQEDARTGDLSGSVMPQGTSSPIPDAEISLGSMSREDSDAYDGTFYFDRIPVGDYVVTIQADGYAPYRDYFVRVSEGQNVRDFVLNFEEHGPLVNGYVTDGATGAPVLGATVGVQGSGYLSRSDVTDHTGWYQLHDVPYGDQQLVATAWGYRDFTETLSITDVVVGRHVSMSEDGSGIHLPNLSGPAATLSASETQLDEVGGTVTLTAGPTGGNMIYSWRENPGNPELGRLYSNMQLQSTVATRELDVPGTYMFGVQVKQDGVLSANMTYITVLVPESGGYVCTSPSDGVVTKVGADLYAYSNYSDAMAFINNTSTPTPAAGTQSIDDGSYLFVNLVAGNTYWIVARDDSGVLDDYGPVTRVVSANSFLNNNEITMVKDSYVVSGTVTTNTVSPFPLEKRTRYCGSGNHRTAVPDDYRQEWPLHAGRYSFRKLDDSLAQRGLRNDI